jgi:hypothetical protein
MAQTARPPTPFPIRVSICTPRLAPYPGVTAAGCSCALATPARSAATPWPSRCTTESSTTLAAHGTR